jgi:hypothetical protein
MQINTLTTLIQKWARIIYLLNYVNLEKINKREKLRIKTGLLRTNISSTCTLQHSDVSLSLSLCAQIRIMALKWVPVCPQWAPQRRYKNSPSLPSKFPSHEPHDYIIEIISIILNVIVTVFIFFDVCRKVRFIKMYFPLNRPFCLIRLRIRINFLLFSPFRTSPFPFSCFPFISEP